MLGRDVVLNPAKCTDANVWIRKQIQQHPMYLETSPVYQIRFEARMEGGQTVLPLTSTERSRAFSEPPQGLWILNAPWRSVQDGLCDLFSGRRNGLDVFRRSSTRATCPLLGLCRCLRRTGGFHGVGCQILRVSLWYVMSFPTSPFAVCSICVSVSRWRALCRPTNSFT